MLCNLLWIFKILFHFPSINANPLIRLHLASWTISIWDWRSSMHKCQIQAISLSVKEMYKMSLSGRRHFWLFLFFSPLSFLLLNIYLNPMFYVNIYVQYWKAQCISQHLYTIFHFKNNYNKSRKKSNIQKENSKFRKVWSHVMLRCIFTTSLTCFCNELW